MSGGPAARPSATVLAAALVALSLASAAPAHAGSLTVRDGNAAWMVTDDPQGNGTDFLLRHFADGTRPDPQFGRDGQTAFALSATNDPPASVRVDATHRTWMVGAGLAGNQPQPVIARFLPDGSPDLRWGVQGKLQLAPGGVAVKPNDLLPLADGSVLVAGEVAGVATPRAVVFHLDARGVLDRRFGSGGLWQYPADGDASTATSLAASADGAVAVAVVVRGAKPSAELWALTDAAPTTIQRQPLPDTSDGEDLRAVWAVDHWLLDHDAGATPVVPAALLTIRPVAPAALASAASDPGEGAFNPFADVAASAPAAAPPDEGLPWTWIAAALMAVAVVAGVLLRRTRRPVTVLRKTPGR